MKQWFSRLIATVAIAVAGWLLLSAAAPAKPAGTLEPDKLIILSTTDVKGKATPCG